MGREGVFQGGEMRRSGPEGGRDSGRGLCCILTSVPQLESHMWDDLVLCQQFSFIVKVLLPTNL